MTTLDNSLKNLVEDGPVSFKPGFEFLRKTEPDVNRFIATEFPEKMQQFLAIEKDHGHFEPDLAYAIKMYLYMAKTLAGKPCIFNTFFDANDCAKAARKLLDDYRLTVDALEEDKDETFKATIAARDEELAVCKEQLKAKDDQIKLKDECLAELAVCKEQLKKKEELMAAMEREVEQIVGEDQLKHLKFKIRFEYLKKTKTVEECWAELPEQIQKVLLGMMDAKQAPKGQPLACITNA
jgi:hypothetical protein